MIIMDRRSFLDCARQYPWYDTLWSSLQVSISLQLDTFCCSLDVELYQLPVPYRVVSHNSKHQLKSQAKCIVYINRYEPKKLRLEFKTYLECTVDKGQADGTNASHEKWRMALLNAGVAQLRRDPSAVHTTTFIRRVQ